MGRAAGQGDHPKDALIVRAGSVAFDCVGHGNVAAACTGSRDTVGADAVELVAFGVVAAYETDADLSAAPPVRAASRAPASTNGHAAADVRDIR